MIKALKNDLGGKHGKIILERNHYKSVNELQPNSSEDLKCKFEEDIKAIEEKDIKVVRIPSKKALYKPESDVKIKMNIGTSGGLTPLTELSQPIKNIGSINLDRIYVPQERLQDAKKLLH